MQSSYLIISSLLNNCNIHSSIISSWRILANKQETSKLIKILHIHLFEKAKRRFRSQMEMNYLWSSENWKSNVHSGHSISPMYLQRFSGEQRILMTYEKNCLYFNPPRVVIIFTSCSNRSWPFGQLYCSRIIRWPMISSFLVSKRGPILSLSGRMSTFGSLSWK